MKPNRSAELVKKTTKPHWNYEEGAMTQQEKINEADARGNRYLADANEAAERGNHAKAEKLYAKGQYWLDRLNKLTGNA